MMINTDSAVSPFQVAKVGCTSVYKAFAKALRVLSVLHSLLLMEQHESFRALSASYPVSHTGSLDHKNLAKISYMLVA